MEMRKEIYFTHTEASDADIASKLTDMMKSPVLLDPPGSMGYTPLRRLNVVTWGDPGKARELKSAAEVLSAEQSGEVTISQPGVVINMPFVVWDGSQR